MNKTYSVVGLLLVVAMLTVGFAATAEVADVSILPMPSLSEKGEQPVDSESAEAPVGGQTSTRGTEAGSEALGDVIPQVEEATSEGERTESRDEEWTADELAALREIARERIRAKDALKEVERVQGHMHHYLRGLWQESVEPFLNELEGTRKSERPEKDQLLESFDRWMERLELPGRDQVSAHWDELIQRFAESTGMAVEDAKGISAEWVDQQRELLRDVFEEIQELKEDLRSVWQGAYNEATGTAVPADAGESA